MSENETIEQLIADYKPNPAKQAHLERVTLVATVGPSGVGKTSLMRATNWPFVVSDVTRLPRPGEVQGIDYNFRQIGDKLREEIKGGEFVQVALGASGDFYGTHAGSYPKEGVATMAILARVIPTFRKLKFARLIPVCISVASYEEWIRRLLKHPVDLDSLKARLAEARESLNLALADPEYHFILNDDLLRARDELLLISQGKDIPRVRSLAARKAAEDMLRQLTK